MRKIFYFDVYKADSVSWTKPLFSIRRFPRGLILWVGPFLITIEI